MSTKLTPKEFTKKYYTLAIEAEKVTGIPALFILSQAALESAWGSKTPGNMLFGIKDTDGINGNEQLITTTEYLKNPDAKFPVIISKTWIPLKKLYKYIVKTWFRKYPSAKDSFIDHGNFLLKNKRYQKIPSRCSNDWRCWCREVADAGYATGTNYANTLIKIGNMIEREL